MSNLPFEPETFEFDFEDEDGRNRPWFHRARRSEWVRSSPVAAHAPPGAPFQGRVPR